jgi:hypothetical protein
VADPSEKSKLPATWEWYGEAVKWFIAIAAGLLAFGFEFVDGGKLEGNVWWPHFVGACALGASAVAGLLSYLQLLGAANLVEVENPSSDQIKRRDQHHQRFTLFYQISVGALGFGILLSAGAWIFASWPRQANEKPTPYTIESIGTEQNPTLVRRTSSRVEVLTVDAAGKLVWREVEAPVEGRP